MSLIPEIRHEADARTFVETQWRIAPVRIATAGVTRVTPTRTGGADGCSVCAAVVISDVTLCAMIPDVTSGAC